MNLVAIYRANQRSPRNNSRETLSTIQLEATLCSALIRKVLESSLELYYFTTPGNLFTFFCSSIKT